jgi:hypothetical protein
MGATEIDGRRLSFDLTFHHLVDRNVRARLASIVIDRITTILRNAILTAQLRTRNFVRDMRL